MQYISNKFQCFPFIKFDTFYLVDFRNFFIDFFAKVGSNRRSWLNGGYNRIFFSSTAAFGAFEAASLLSTVFSSVTSSLTTGVVAGCI